MNVTPVDQRSAVHSAIALAASRTGVDFSYLLGQAQVESGLNANARAATSSATGLYQFVEQSWLGVVKEHGAEHGLGWAADSIRQTGSGRFVVADPAVRRQILALRRDPQSAALMAAEHASDNKAALEQTLGREAGGTDLYMAHFLGLGGARQFLSQLQANPDRPAAQLFPAAARANRGVFFERDGSARSLGEVYRNFAGKLDRGAAGASGAAGGAPVAGGFSADLQRAIHDAGAEVVLGRDASAGEGAWLQTTLANLNVVSAAPADAVQPAVAYRPTPATARLAYLMLANLAG